MIDNERIKELLNVVRDGERGALELMGYKYLRHLHRKKELFKTQSLSNKGEAKLLRKLESDNILLVELYHEFSKDYDFLFNRSIDSDLKEANEVINNARLEAMERKYEKGIK
ncbi:hypothetical protein PXY30_004451 [Salmonella enterica]|nr:hypothetical protein [Salmonella enterica]